jgi:hypothetical protein
LRFHDRDYEGYCVECDAVWFGILSDVYRNLYTPSYTLKMVGAGFCETSPNGYQSVRRHIPGDHNFRRLDNEFFVRYLKTLFIR